MGPLEPLRVRQREREGGAPHSKGFKRAQRGPRQFFTQGLSEERRPLKDEGEPLKRVLPGVQHVLNEHTEAPWEALSLSSCLVVGGVLTATLLTATLLTATRLPPEALSSKVLTATRNKLLTATRVAVKSGSPGRQ